MTTPMAIDWYTTGGGTDIVLALNYVAAFCNSPLMVSMARLAIVVAVIILAWKIVFTGDMKGVLHWFVVAGVVWGGFVEVKRTVHVNDTANPFLANRVVDNVPWAVAFVGGHMSGAGRFVSDQITAFSSLPDSVSYQRNGFLFGANLLSQATRFRVVNDHLSATLANFLEQCIVTGTMLNHTDFEVVANSDNLAGVIPAQLSNALAFVAVRENAGSVTTTVEECAAGYTDILSRMDADVNRVLLREARGRYPSSEFSDAEAAARYTDDLEGFQQAMIQNSAAARDRIRQSMFITALDGSIERFIAASGNGASMQRYIAAKAEAQAFASKNTAGLLAAKFVPLAKSVLEVTYIVFFPIAVAFMMTPFWPIVLRGYFGGYVWLASWEAVSVPLHNMAINSYAKSYQAQAGFIDESGATANVISYANHLGVRAVEQDIASTAGYFMSFAPILAFGLLFGASRLASAATSSISATQGAANEVAREGVSGNVSLNTPSMDVIRSNKLDASTHVDQGRASGYLGDGALFTKNADGSIAFSAGSALTTGGVDVKYASDLGQRNSERLEQLQASAAESLNSFSEVLTTTTRDSQDLFHNIAKNTQLGDGVMMSNGGTLTENARNLLSRSEALARELGVDSSTILSASGAVNAGLSAGRASALGINANAGLTAMGRETASERFSDVMRVVEDSGFSKDYADVVNAVQTASTSENQSHGITSNMGTVVSLDRVATSASHVNQSFREVETFTVATEGFRSDQISASIQGNSAYIAQLDANMRALGMSDEARINALSAFAMGKGFVGDSDTMMAVNMFVADSARAAGIPSIAGGSGVVFGGDGQPGGGSFPQRFAPESVEGRDIVAERFIADSMNVARSADRELSDEYEIDAAAAARRDEQAQFKRGAESQTGHAEMTARSAQAIAEAYRQETRKSPLERAGERIRGLFE